VTSHSASWPAEANRNQRCVASSRRRPGCSKLSARPPVRPPFLPARSSSCVVPCKICRRPRPDQPSPPPETVARVVLAEIGFSRRRRRRSLVRVVFAARRHRAETLHSAGYGRLRKPLVTVSALTTRKRSSACVRTIVSVVIKLFERTNRTTLQACNTRFSTLTK